MQVLASEAEQIAVLRLADGQEPVPDAFAGLRDVSVATAAPSAYAAARTDSGLVADRDLRSSSSARSPTRAAAERAASAAPVAAARSASPATSTTARGRLATLLSALTVPVREHASDADRRRR